MARLTRVTLIALALLAIGGASASGSFSARLDLTGLEVNVEQEVTRAGAWTVYAGTGFAATWTSVEKLQPYTLACTSWDVGLAFAELCGELRAPVLGPGEWVRLFVTVAW